MDQANVRSVDALKDLRAAIVVYAEEVLGALGAAEMELRRTTRWLSDEQGQYWVGEIKRRKEKLSSARAELSRRKMSQMNGQSSSHSEQRELVEEAEKRLQEAETRLAKVKKWIPILQQATLEYHSTSRRLEGLVSGDLPKALAQLERVMDRIEAYLQVAPPTGTSALGGTGSGEFTSAARTGGGGGTAVADTTPTEEPQPAETAPAAAEAEIPAEPPEIPGS